MTFSSTLKLKKPRNTLYLLPLFVMLLEGCIALNVSYDDFRKKKKKKKLKEQGKGQIAQVSGNNDETMNASADEKHPAGDEPEGDLSNEK